MFAIQNLKMATDILVFPPESAHSWCLSSPIDDDPRNFTCIHHTFAWTLEDFIETREMTEDQIKSGTFRIRIGERGKEEIVTSWQLVLLPKKVSASNNQIFVVLVKVDGPAVRASYKISQVNSNEEVIVSDRIEPLLFTNDNGDDIKNKKHEDMEYWLAGSFATFAQLEAYVEPREDLTLLCDITVLHEACVRPREIEEVAASTKRHHRSEKEKEMLANINHELNQQLEHTYRNGDFADMEVVCNTEVFKCHQFMLAARSPVLRAMFQSPMTEAATRRLEIKDLSPDVVDAMLLFVYTGNVPNLAEAAAELLEAAEKYQIDQLKDICEQQLIETTDIGNAVAHLFLGDRFQAMELRKVAMEFVVQHFKAVMANPEWKQKLIGHPALLAEITVEFLAGM
jgi:speckle-type POZ protein